MRYNGMARFQHRKFISHGDFGPVEWKMKQIIEEQDAVKIDKDENRARQATKKIWDHGSANSVLKTNKKKVNLRQVGASQNSV